MSDPFALKNVVPRTGEAVNIIKGYPPNIDLIRAVLPVPPGAVFAYGHVVYVPDPPHELSECIAAHEDVHMRRQLAMGVDVWWNRYLNDPFFRQTEEILAHTGEYQTFCRLYKGVRKRKEYMTVVAGRLASPMYALAMTPKKARDMITGILEQIGKHKVQ